MKITKHANRHIEASMSFECRFCGCEFTAEKGEYSILSMYSNWANASPSVIGYSARCECPECGMECITTVW